MSLVDDLKAKLKEAVERMLRYDRVEVECEFLLNLLRLLLGE